MKELIEKTLGVALFSKTARFTNTGWFRKWLCYQVIAIFGKGMNQEVILLKFVFEKRSGAFL